MVAFCSRTGSLVALSNDGRTAHRNHPAQEFNNGVVISNEPLTDNQLFEVRIDKKISSWSGSIEVGVTTSDPNTLSFPTSATGFREGTWIMSGCSILKDGHTSLEEYGQDLDQLAEGDRIGILRTSSGCLHFYVNGVDQGQAASHIPPKVYAVVDMYGKCAQVSIVDDVNRETLIQNEVTNERIQEMGFSTFSYSEQLIFHEKTGTLVKLTNGRRTAERRRPLDEFNNGVVMTNRPIKDDEMFEIRIDRLVDKWSGSIEVGITTHNPTNLDFPATMTNMRSGTIMMSGCGILTNGKGTRREYGDFNLDELADCDRIGLMRKKNGCLHYYINGQDQGVAATSTPNPAWGVVDLYGMAVKVTIIYENDPDYNENEVRCSSSGNLTHRANEFIRRYTEVENTATQEEEELLFHPTCGNHAAVINNGKTAHRPNAVDDFNNGVVITNRHLRPGEMFDVRLDKLIDKWAGSIEIGVTTHSPVQLDYPSTMTNIRTGTWMMTGNGVMHNGTTVLDEYGQNLDRLKVGDRVGALRKEDGTLHFFVNGIDQGEAATNVPSNVYGVIDLYGQAAEATIIDHNSSAVSVVVMEENVRSHANELRFHSRTGRNAQIINRGKGAFRPNPRGEFNDAIVMTNRPLKDNELFEVSIDKMVDRWSGSIEAGVTLIHPVDLDLPSTMTDIDYDTWMLSGSAVMQDGSTIKNGYSLDLDKIQKGSRIGMMRALDGTLHFYLDGEDMGVACTNVPSGVYAVIDLYGQCAEVTITNSSRIIDPETASHLDTQDVEISITSPISAAQITHSFSECYGQYIQMSMNKTIATRVVEFSHGLVFSEEPLRSPEMFEVRVERLNNKWSGSLSIGVTTLSVASGALWSNLPAIATDISKPTWIVTGGDVKLCGKNIKEFYTPSLERLRVGDRIGVKRLSDATMHVFINGEDQGIAANNIPKNVFAVVDVFGSVDQVAITSGFAFEQTQTSVSLSRPPSLYSSDVSDEKEDDLDEDTAEASYIEFQSNHGKNIELSDDKRSGSRVASYNQALVFSDKPLLKNSLFKIKLDKLNERWTSSLMLGVVDFNPEKYNLPVSATALKKSSWIIQGDVVFHSGEKVQENFGPNIDNLHVGDTVGLLLDDDNSLHLYVNNEDQGVVGTNMPLQCYAVLDLYGQCEQVTIINSQDSGQGVSEYKEKARMEEGVKEKINRRNTEVKSPKNCDYQNLCNRFKSFLALPEGYFDSSYNCCYCDGCHKARGGSTYNRKGDPPKDVAVPVGWYKFGLRLPAKADCLSVFKKWHTAYHGSVVSSLRRILDTGDFSNAEDLSLISLSLQNRLTSQFDEKNKPEDGEDTKQISISPTLKYAGSQKFAPPIEYKDPKTRKSHQSRVAFQVCVKPGSYKVSGQSIGVNEQIDPKFNNNEVDWSTKEKGALILCALLVKVE